MTAVVNLFSGIGWDFAAEQLGLDVDGIDNEPTVAATRTALGWATTLADVTDLDPTEWAGVDGLIASPPCQSWSRAGKGLGLDDPRGQLVWQPLVWALAARPRWIACEQVPEARPAYALIAHRLREAGYGADVYTVSAETFGVPQTRLRVFLVAHRDRQPDRPTPTHQRYRKGVEPTRPVDLLGRLPWVSMFEALSVELIEQPASAAIGATGVQRVNGTGGGAQATAQAGASGEWVYDPRQSWHGQQRHSSLPAPTVTAAAGGRGVAVIRMTRQRGAGMAARHGVRPDRDLDEPAFTIDAGARRSWAHVRPSTTVCADPRVSPPVHHDNGQTMGAVPLGQAGADKPIALSEAQGCTLMAFPAGVDKLLAGTKADRWRLIGNAVCPPVADAVLATLVAPA